MREIEEWRDIEGYEGLYLVSSLGRIKSLKCGKERILKPVKHTCGYLLISLCKDGKDKSYTVHRLVVNAFLPNPLNLPEVNHIDKDRTNNKVDNLEWCDRTYNIRFSKAKPVNQFTLDGRFIRTWECAWEVQYQLGFKQSYICACCKGKRKFAYGYLWKYVD